MKKDDQVETNVILSLSKDSQDDFFYSIAIANMMLLLLHSLAAPPLYSNGKFRRHHAKGVDTFYRLSKSQVFLLVTKSS